LLSLTKCIAKHGVQFTVNNRNKIWSIFVTQIKFDKEIQHVTGKLFAIDIKPLSSEAAYILMYFNKFHNILGHLHNVTLEESAKSNKIQLTGVHHRPCTHCAEEKIKRIPKEPTARTPRKYHRTAFGYLLWMNTPTSYGHTFQRPKMNKYQQIFNT
jgi:hypothetical protein